MCPSRPQQLRLFTQMARNRAVHNSLSPTRGRQQLGHPGLHATFLKHACLLTHYKQQMPRISRDPTCAMRYRLRHSKTPLISSAGMESCKYRPAPAPTAVARSRQIGRASLRMLGPATLVQTGRRAMRPRQCSTCSPQSKLPQSPATQPQAYPIGASVASASRYASPAWQPPLPHNIPVALPCPALPCTPQPPPHLLQ
jgi:hypothetical protein